METKGPSIFDELQVLSPEKLYVSSTRLILASRINQALCDEAEAGRAHGDFILDGRCLMLLDGQVKIHLDQEVAWGLGQRYRGEPLDFFSGGDPLIEATNRTGPIPINRDNMWMTQFPYLRASVSSRLGNAIADEFGVYDFEYQQAAALGRKWGLSGNWGSPNRLDGETRWHEDVSLLTTDGDSAGLQHLVHDADGNPQYALERIPTPAGDVLLPYRYLKRSGCWGSRRVFFPPEKDIAIWYLGKINESIKNIILTAKPELLLYSNCPSGTVVGCLPGGAPSVSGTDISTLRGHDCWILICDPDMPSDIEFAVKMTARLRREYHTPHILCTGKNNHSPVEIGLAKLCKMANNNNIFVPDEVRVDYLGDLTEKINLHELKPVIQDVLNAGECMNISVHDFPPMLLASHIASRLRIGYNIFNDFWPVPAMRSTLILANRNNEALVLRYRQTTKVQLADCRFVDSKPEEQMRQLQELVRTADVILITADELMEDHPALCNEVVQHCNSRGKTVILFPSSLLAPRIMRLVTRSATAARTGETGGLGIMLIDSDGGAFSISALFQTGGALIHAKPVDAADSISTSRMAPSTPPDFSKNTRLLELAEVGQPCSGSEEITAANPGADFGLQFPPEPDFNYEPSGDGWINIEVIPCSDTKED